MTLSRDIFESSEDATYARGLGKTYGSFEIFSESSDRSTETRSKILPRVSEETGMPIADSQATLWHRGIPVPLLPSGPDGVRGSFLHRT